MLTFIFVLIALWAVICWQWPWAVVFAVLALLTHMDIRSSKKREAEQQAWREQRKED